MGIITIALIATGLVIASKAISTQNASDNVDYNFIDAALTRVELLQSYVSLRFKAINPTQVNLKITEVSVNVLVNGTVNIGKVYITDANVIIPAKTEQVLKIPLVIKHLGNGLVLYNMIINNEPINFLQIKGYVKANGFTKTIDDKIQLKKQIEN